jgi:ATP-dependent DNA helicase PIF1
MIHLEDLTEQQQNLYKALEMGKSVFVSGLAGSGKTTIINLFVQNMKDNKHIAVTSTTGTSAVLLGGTTLHSYLGIGLGQGTVDELIDQIVSKKPIHSRWERLNILIIDEVSMLTPQLFDKLEEIARIIRHNRHPFGGIQLILSGDFLQLPCVNTDMFCFETDTWNKCIDEIFYMFQVFRQTDPVFQNCLANVRLGNITKSVKKVLNSRVGVELHNEWDIKPTRLFPTNVNVDNWNEKELNLLADEGREFRRYVSETRNNTTNQFILEKFMKSCPAVHNLQLCIGAQVMLLINLDLDKGLANGSRGIIEDFCYRENGNYLYPVVRFLNGELRMIDHHTWQQKEIVGVRNINGERIVKYNILCEVIQIPLRVAYAMTIHKCQGASVDCAEIDLSDIFEFGQGYVALSRVRTLEGLSIISINYHKIKAHPKALKFYEDLE